MNALSLPAILTLTGTILGAQSDSRLQLFPRELPLDDGSTYQADAGRFHVMENRANPESRSIRLGFVRLHSTAEDPGPPVFLLPGGPGNRAVPFARSPIWHRFLELGDVVLLDPRGVGESENDLEWNGDSIDAFRFLGEREDAVAHMAEVCETARRDLQERGIDLAGYATPELVEDVGELAEALEYDTIHVLAHSYGTHLGLGILAAHPELIARFVSVGTAGTNDMQKLPSDLDASLRALSELVAEDPTVGEDMPDLYSAVEEVMADLAKEPLPMPLMNGATGEPFDAPLGSFGLQLILVADLGDTADLPIYPRLIRSLQERDPSVVAWFYAKRARQFSSLPLMMLSVRGASGATPERWERIRREGAVSPFGTARCLFSPESDGALGVRDVGDAFRQPVTSNVPTLFISGSLDAHTPPAQAERVRAGFENSGHVVVEYAGHEDLLPDPEVQQHILDFLAGAKPTDARIEREPLRFAPLSGPAPGFDHPALD